MRQRPLPFLGLTSLLVLSLLSGPLQAAQASPPVLAGGGGAFELIIQDLGISLATEDFQQTGDWVVLEAPELLQGDGDLNGDGDASDKVLAVHDLYSQETVFLASSLPLSDAASYEARAGRVALVLEESSLGSQGGTDLNGDGDQPDFGILHTVELFTPGASIEAYGDRLMGTSYYGQAGCLDPQAPAGFSLTKGLRVTVE